MNKYLPEDMMVRICCSTGCLTSGAGGVLQELKKYISEKNISFGIKSTGCHGFCEQGPIVVVKFNATGKNIFYQKVKKEDVAEIIDKIMQDKGPVERLLHKDPATKQTVISEEDIPFYKYQQKVIFANNGVLDPESIDEYISAGGYQALKKTLSGISPDGVLSEIKKAGLRGRGGAGFPTGRKWESARKAVNELVQSVKCKVQSDSIPSTEPGAANHEPRAFIICNADEGDPGAFMDRSILEGNPHSVIEGMVIGAWAVAGGTGAAAAGYIYVRNEYPLAVKHFSLALAAAREKGFLGKNILGSGFDFDITVCRGAGAFVCGESSALRASIEGKIGEPAVKYVHATDKGLYDMPTVLNNVKTWANVPQIINRGADWFSSIGTEKSKGTMLFSLVGKINNTGLIEVPMGIKLREIIYDIGGGIPDNKKFKAVQTGGPSGGCLPESCLDLPVDYESLTKAGSMMGSGGMIVMDENTCMVSVAKYFLNFTQEESCGKCTPCRDGSRVMHEILNRLTEGTGREGDIEVLEEVGKMVVETSLCALGGSAPNPVLSTIKYFREEYEAHLREKRCPAKSCKALIKYSVIEDLCNGCTVCMKKCPQKAIEGRVKEKHKIIQEKCIKCNICYESCKFGAIRIE